MSEYIWLAALAGLFVVTLPLARIDLREKRLPNVYTYSLFIWAVSCAGANAILQRDVWRLLTPLGTGIGIAFLLFLSGWVAGGGVGFGDVKLVAGTSVMLAFQTWQLALLGIALAFIAGVAAIEEMPRNSRAYALSVLAMAAGFGAGVAVVALRVCDTGPQGWRIVYVMALLWLPVSVSLSRHLRETRRFEKLHTVAPPLPRNRLALTCAVALTSNLFIAASSYFQNNYLDKVRHYSGGGIALFTTLTVTPASIGLIAGGRLADVVGRRRLIAWCTPASTALLVLGFWVGGPLMWLTALGGGILAGMAYPAMQVYRTELFPTGNRGVANAITTTTALVSGSVGILIVGVLRDLRKLGELQHRLVRLEDDVCAHGNGGSQRMTTDSAQ